jgi:hypothetical protein
LLFPTALLAEGLSHYDAAGRQAAVTIYTGIFLVAALLFNLVWGCVAGRRGNGTNRIPKD